MALNFSLTLMRQRRQLFLPLFGMHVRMWEASKVDQHDYNAYKKKDKGQERTMPMNGNGLPKRKLSFVITNRLTQNNETVTSLLFVSLSRHSSSSFTFLYCTLLHTHTSSLT